MATATRAMSAHVAARAMSAHGTHVSTDVPTHVTADVTHVTTDMTAAIISASTATAIPATPAFRTAPAKTVPPPIAAPIPAWAVPAIEIEAIMPSTENEQLRLLDGVQIDGVRTELACRHGLRGSRHKRADCQSRTGRNCAPY
jgi:hypothetical protein